ncbi:MAG: right-handed parallel beta-helix repeat-containing protein [Kiritimatiellales bacterium]|nr:right-handed parallel beta-helix repeat-containing protein [Kiritimatiellales bacterium]MCF7863443.1 right-handed parallel beta-helix repeat-containing protein [Kiritimatiellales bacterium]
MSAVIEIKNSENATPEVCRVLAECPDGSVLMFPDGEYHFYPEGAFEKYYYVSNNRHGLKRVAFPIIGKKNITIDGNGARFIFHGEIIPVVVENSGNTVLRNFSVDWERPFYSQGTIIAADRSGVTVEIDHAAYPYHVEAGQIFFDGEGWSGSFCEGLFELDAATGMSAYLSGDAMGVGIRSDWTVEEIREGCLRIVERFPRLPTIGNVLILRHYPRLCPGIHLKQSNDTLIENVTLHHAGGMGIIGQFCENITVRACKVTPPAGRNFSVTVDATHFVNCRGLVALEDCLFEGQLDDASNVHGINTRVKKILGDTSLVTELVHHEQHGVEIGFPGDRMQFSGNETLLAYAENSIAAIDWIDERTSRITFKNKLPKEIRPGHVLENMSWVADLHITGCTCRSSRARGYLISTPGRVVIENNRIEAPGSGIKISGDANYWFESGAVQDVLIRNNDFGNCCYGPEEWGRSVIDIDPEMADPHGNPECFHRNIRIEGNRFSTFDSGILFARSVDGIRFVGNTVRRTDRYPKTRRAAELLVFEACAGVEVSGNMIDPLIKETLMSGADQPESFQVGRQVLGGCFQ